MSDDLTLLLERAREGGEPALEDLIVAVYQELRRTAQNLVGGEKAGLTLAATDIVHEAFFRLSRNETGWQDRRHFFASAAGVMRKILIDHARRKKAGKRIPQDELISIELAPEPSVGADIDLLALDQALDQLAETSPRQAKIVELRYFAGLGETEIAETMGVSRMTVSREWRVARLRLRRALRP